MSLGRILYIEIANDLRQKIKNSSDYRLLPERNLSVVYGVSRPTIRKAVKLLEQENLIKKKHGAANFINHLPIATDFSYLRTMKDKLESIGFEFRVKILSFQKIIANELVTQELKLQKNQYVYYFERLFYNKENILIYDQSYIPVELFPNFTKQDAFIKMEYVEQKCHFKLKLSQEKVFAIIPNKKLMNIFQLPKKEALLTINIVSELYSGRLWEYTIQYYHPDLYFDLISYKKNI